MRYVKMFCLLWSAALVVALLVDGCGGFLGSSESSGGTAADTTATAGGGDGTAAGGSGTTTGSGTGTTTTTGGTGTTTTSDTTGDGGSEGSTDSGGGGDSGATTVTPWAKAFGGIYNDDGYSVVQTADGGYMVAAQTSSFGAGGIDAWLLKLDATGGVAWQKTYGGTIDDYAYSIVQTSDGGYMVAGGRGGNGELWLVKLDSTGGVSWQKIYGRTSLATYEGANSVVQTADGGYIVVGYAYYTSSAYDVWVLKLDSSGGVTWQKRYGGTGNDYGHSVVQTTDGGYMVAAQTSSFGAGGSDVWLLKLDSTGRVSWQKTYGGSGNEHGYSVVQTSDGGYAVAGFTASAGAGGYDVWVLKLDSSGAVTWQKAYGGSSDEYGRSVVQTSDGGYVVTGRASSAGAGNADVLVLKLDGTGGLAFNTSSGMSVTDTAVTPADTTVTAAATSAAVTDTAITPADTTVTPADTNATVTTLAP